MSVNATISPLQDGSYLITLSFTDPETGAAMTPASLTWTLVDRAGNVINSRDAIALTPAPSVSVLLDGADLAEQTDDDMFRRFLIDGTYDSSLKVGAALKGELVFYIQRRGQKAP